MSQKISLRARALAMLARQEMSRAVLARKLMPYVQAEDDLSALLDELAQKHWQSDARFAEMYVHSKSTHQGSLRIKQALHQKGVQMALIEDFLPDQQQQLTSAIRVLQKKFPQPPLDIKTKRKCMQFLAYRGFSMDIIQTALKQAWNETVDMVNDDWDVI